MIVLAPPAHIHQLPSPAKELNALLEALEGPPEALIEGKNKKVYSHAMRAFNAWQRTKEKLLPTLSEQNRSRLEEAMVRMHTAHGVDSVIAALDASDLLAGRSNDDRRSRLGAADRTCMRAWMQVEQGQWGELIDLQGVFKPFLDQDQATYGKALAKVQADLIDLKAAAEAKRSRQAKRAIEDLLERVDDLEKAPTRSTK
jgi:hypothetical protein